MGDANIIENKIRILSLINLFFVFVYNSITWENTNASWVHSAHIGSEAIVILATIVQLRSFTGIATLLQMGVVALDAIVTFMTAVMINRCLQELSNSCTVRFAEGVIWITIGAIHVIATAFQISQLYRLFYTPEKYYDFARRQRNAHILKLGPILMYLVVGNPTGINRLFIVHLLADGAGILSTVSKDNWGWLFIWVSIGLLSLDALLFTAGFSGTLKEYTLFWTMACDVALFIFSYKHSLQIKNKFV